jgi:signal peptidase
MWYIIIGLIIAIYAAINIFIPGIFSGTIESYVIRPILWITLALITLIIAKHEGLNIWRFKKIRKWEIGRSPAHAALLVGGFHVSLLIISGLYFGFGKSPNVITIQTFFIFLIFIFSIIFGIELSRSYLIKKGTKGRRNTTLTLAIVAIICMLIQIRLLDIFQLSLTEPLKMIKFIGETIIPLLALSLFVSYLAYLGGAFPAIIYMGILNSFEMYSPILPDLGWSVKALIGILAPTIGFLVIQQSLQEKKHHVKKVKRLRKTRDPTISWVGIALISLLIIFFSFGYFGVQPTIISSGSMQPALDVGDIVIVSEEPLEKIKEGDIIQFKLHNISNIHRVHSVHALEEDAYPIMFITKGDANNEPDIEPVMPDQIEGKIIFNIPKLGWIPLFFKTIFTKIGLNM